MSSFLSLSSQRSSKGKTQDPLAGRRAVLKHAAMCFGLALIFVLVALAEHRHNVHVRELRRCQSRMGVVIAGDLEFQEDIFVALCLLQNRVPDAFQFVTNHLVIVKQGNDFDHLDPLVTPPLVLFTKKTARDVPWCAGALVHEAKHAEQVERSRARHAGGMVYREIVGTNQEIEANLCAATALEKAGFPRLAGYLAEEHGTNLLRLAAAEMGPSDFEKWMISDKVFVPWRLERVDPALWRVVLQVRSVGQEVLVGGVSD